MTRERLEEVLAGYPAARVCVVGDLFLDKYLDIDPALGTRSLETGLEARQVVRTRCFPGAAGNVAKNLAALGVGRVEIVSVIGEDGDGYEVRRALRQWGVRQEGLVERPDTITPTYCKPVVWREGHRPAELNRLDTANRKPLPNEAEAAVIARLERAAARCDAVAVVDQVEGVGFGVVTEAVRERVADLARARHPAFFLADSRARIGAFRGVALKPNLAEARAALGERREASPEDLAREMARRTGAPEVFLTQGERGLTVWSGGRTEFIPAPSVEGDTDPCGAGDSVTAAVVASLCAGATPFEAARVAVRAASVTVRQIGVTGEATRDSIRQAFQGDS